MAFVQTQLMNAALADLVAEVLLRPEGPDVPCVLLTLRAA